PGAGDAIQAAKAGLLEVADIIVVNKADRPGAEQTVRELRGESDAPILTSVASEGTGIPELMAAVTDHIRTDTQQRRAARARVQILSLAQTRVRSHPDLDRLAEEVAKGAIDAYRAADLLIPPSTPIAVHTVRW
ncbi:MAG: methylmalonyl Co-A mutase-associated GTPase MeaB, partial [Nocardia sp.]|nr:methylmalonyl Co-A mutase-associated GTPase MeaB [Nocardia sp.]